MTPFPALLIVLEWYKEVDKVDKATRAMAF